MNNGPKNRYFDDGALAILLHPRRWRLVSALARPEAAAIHDARHGRWMRRNQHAHAYREIMIVLRGRACYGFKGRIYPARPGTVFYFDSLEEHDCGYPVFSAPCEHLWIAVLGDHFTVWLIKHGHRRRCNQIELPLLCTQQETGLDFERALFSLSGQRLWPEHLLRARCLAALTALVCAAVEKGFAPREKLEPENFQKRIVATIQKHLGETAGRGASLASLARAAGYSKYHFLRLFKRHTGQTIQGYIDFCRWRKLKQLRAEGRLQKDIADALGFSCPQSFSRWCRKKAGGRR